MAHPSRSPGGNRAPLVQNKYRSKIHIHRSVCYNLSPSRPHETTRDGQRTTRASQCTRASEFECRNSIAEIRVAPRAESFASLASRRRPHAHGAEGPFRKAVRQWVCPQGVSDVTVAVETEGEDGVPEQGPDSQVSAPLRRQHSVSGRYPGRCFVASAGTVAPGGGELGLRRRGGSCGKDDGAVGGVGVEGEETRRGKRRRRREYLG